MEVIRKQKPMNSWLGAIQCHRHARTATLTALVVILFVVHGCYGDQNERDHHDIDTSSSQVQLKKQPSHQAHNFKVTLHDRPLLRDETINRDEDEVSAATAKTVSTSSFRSAHVLVNKSERSVKRNSQTRANALDTTKPTTTTPIPTPTVNYRFNAKRDQHRQLHQSRHVIGNTPQLNPFTQYKYAFENTSDVNNRASYTFHQQQQQMQQQHTAHHHQYQYQEQQQQSHERVPSSKPKITSKLYDPSSYGRTTTYLSYNLVRDHVQKTKPFQSSPAIIKQHSPPPSLRPSLYTTHFQQQTSTSFMYKPYYRSFKHRNNCNQCRIIPGALQRHKPYLPNRVPFYGMYFV